MEHDWLNDTVTLYKAIFKDWSSDFTLEHHVLLALERGFEWSPYVGTAAVMLEDSTYKLLVNRAFVEEHCPDPRFLLYLLLHELHHLTLAHHSYVMDEAIPRRLYNLAFDALVNSMLARFIPRENDLSRVIYDEYTFPELVLRPPDWWYDPAALASTGMNGTLLKLMCELYPPDRDPSVNISVERIIELLIMIEQEHKEKQQNNNQQNEDEKQESQSNKSGNGNPSSHDHREGHSSEETRSIHQGVSSGELPDEEEPVGATEAQNAIKFESGADPMLLGNHDYPGDAGDDAPGGMNSGAGRGSLLRRRRYGVAKKPPDSTIQVLKNVIRHAVHHEHRSSVHDTVSSTGVSVHPNYRDRMGFAKMKLYQQNLLWRTFTPRKEPIPILLDVSSSFAKYIPTTLHILHMLYKQFFEGDIILHQFSTEIRPLTVRELRTGQVDTSGGTDVNLCLRYALAQSTKRTIVISDGKFNQPENLLVRRLKQDGKHIILVVPAKISGTVRNVKSFTQQIVPLNI